MHYQNIVLLATAFTASAHPGHNELVHPKLLAGRHAHHATARSALEACKDKLTFRELQGRAVTRRAATVDYHRKVRRDVNPTGTGHNKTDLRSGVTASSDPDSIFGSSHTCILNPEGEIGPYWVKGELIRSRLREGQPGVPVILDGQFINVETCAPITDLYWDLWNCNSTGVYSGVQQSGNGNDNDESNLDKTFLRGIQKTDSDGVVQFETIFPGHYSGRTNHHHMVAWLNATVQPNNTLTSGYASHIGQIFYDQDLVDAVEATYPYNTNTISQTLNAEDHVVLDELGENEDSDPFLDYVYLGDAVEDGLVAWITIGINTSASYETSYSFEYTSGGGVAVDSDSSGA